jgi:hypothetical protein
MTATAATDLHEGAAVAATSPGPPHGSLEPGRDARGDRAANKDRLDACNKHRRLLFAIAYCMLGSVADADDNCRKPTSAGSRRSPATT